MTNDKYEMTINGRKVTTDHVIEVINPANEAVFATVARANSATVDEAVAAARQAFPPWAATPYSERVATMRKIGDVLTEHADDIGRILTTEQGKILADAVGEVTHGAFLAQYLADNVSFDPVVYPSRTGRHIVEHRKPLGVVAAITPWNFPLTLLWIKILPALIAGNTVIVKPAATTPLASVRVVELLNEVLPPDDIDDVVARANATEYGLGATIWGRDLDRAFDVAMRIESGMVWVNQHMDFDFGVTARGAKHSGLGGELGKEGFDAFTQAYVVDQTAW